ncbi:putative adenylate cyclase; with Tetratricopeptide TPR_4 motifs for protein-protein interaction [Cupriavidus taiwanensis]|uniref:adenylate/guanylate cyclase domain-containing protein n=1 Tax=Cupriavidus taiwanensis TaxID=164546 RepID=UPI000E134A62|nr:adenylate/guanylate cyclase domain-containing protein [Cupriavidus taiwanensis]SPA01679.1 putative adenylate cyclase; with Tetratricopeptide TPR_4 motifs for protein-protein interaction [Cupriavidus taiwanensis]
MRCSQCGFGNLAGANFCEACGARLARVCPQCGAEATAAARFCRVCGVGLPDAPATTAPGPAAVRQDSPAPVHYTPPHLAGRILAEQAAMEARGETAGERKTITALFADMAGSTALTQDLDPEDARRLIDPVVTLMMEAVHHYEGYVAKFLGDGILALFGAPIAHEDHALRALYAALRMQDAMHRHSDRVRLEQGIPLQVRIGIHTGEVVVRSIRKDDLHTDYDPVGHTIHIASRMEGIATPASILVSESTHKLTEGYFEFTALGTTSVKGVREPLAVYEVIGPGPLRTRLQVAAHRGLARFVGRQDELAHLNAALEQAKAGHGRIVAVVGEAGVGKSRLFHEFKVRSQQGCLALETFSVSHGKAFAYLPLIEMLKNYFQITAHDGDRICREKLTGRLLTLDRSLEEHLPYLLYLLGVVEPDSQLPTMDPALRRQRTFDAIARLLVRESRNQPLEVIFEDLQWLDGETEAFLNMLVDHVPGARIVLLVNYRPEYSHRWDAGGHYSQLRLQPLGQAEAQELLTALLGDDPSLVPLKRLILDKTEGNPFFMEEVVQTLAEEGALLGQPGAYRIEKAPALLHIPTTVQGVLAARIDRLPLAQKELLQTLAVIGKEFPLGLVLRVTGLPEDTLHPLLRDLQGADFIYERPAFPEVEYAFKHALTQEVAGSSLLTERRSALHESSAQAIEAMFQGRLKDYCSELAHHYSHSGNVPKAVEYLHCAGQQALQRSAQEEAIRHLSEAIALLKRQPDSGERARLELTLLLTLGPALIAARGQASPEVEANYRRAMSLCEQGRQTPYVFSAQLGMWAFYQLRAQYQVSLPLARRLLALATESQKPKQLAEGHRALGATLFRLGLLEEARAHMEAVLAVPHPEHSAYDFLTGYGRDPMVHATSTLAWILWYQGFADQALARSREALALARARPDAYNLALCLVFAAEQYRWRRDPAQAREYAEAAIAISCEQGFPIYLAWGTVLQGWALSEQGSHEEGIAQMRRGLAAYEATGGELGMPNLLAMLAEACGRAGQPAAALDVLTRAQAMIEETGERLDEAAVYRLRGDLLLRLAAPDAGAAASHEAEACYQRALAVAHGQGARPLELQAALSLARLWQRQGKGEAAREALARVHGSFSEGTDGADWQEGRALLAELANDTARDTGPARA